VDWKSIAWAGFVGSRPLEVLRELQLRLARRVRFPPLRRLPKRVAGLDVSYPHEGFGVAAFAVVDVGSQTLVDHETFADRTPFPYIPGYLSFRELPLYLKLLQRLEQDDRLEPWVLVDGNGILHPRRAGVASLVGLAKSIRTVGVSKHLLCGRVAASNGAVVSEDGDVLGYRLSRGSKRSTLYVSPGSGIDVAGVRRLVASVLTRHRLPEPLYHADRLSRAAARELFSAAVWKK
jgi:deoxyribonuclease V